MAVQFCIHGQCLWQETKHPICCVASTMCASSTMLLHPTPPHHPICCVASTMCASSTMLLHPPHAANVCFSPRPSTRRGPTTKLLRTSQTYDMMNRMFRWTSRGPRCGARALRPSSPNLLPRRSTFVTVLLIRRASARACRVGMTHMAKWTADSWAFHCSCAVMHCQVAVWHVRHKHEQGTGQDCRHEPNITHVRSLCPHPAHSLLNTSVW